MGGLEDEGEEVGEEAGLDGDGLEGLLRLLPAGGVERGKKKRGEIRHGGEQTGERQGTLQVK